MCAQEMNKSRDDAVKSRDVFSLFHVSGATEEQPALI